MSVFQSEHRFLQHGMKYICITTETFRGYKVDSVELDFPPPMDHDFDIWKYKKKLAPQALNGEGLYIDHYSSKLQ